MTDVEALVERVYASCPSTLSNTVEQALKKRQCGECFYCEIHTMLTSQTAEITRLKRGLGIICDASVEKLDQQAAALDEAREVIEGQRGLLRAYRLDGNPSDKDIKGARLAARWLTAHPSETS